ncbi:hypothetical protein BKH44_03990 [Helicobacter sp. 13S00477-4]|nr:hypothetical protein BKH44_03990 [Helicobacter sp. 13S00477-4]
MIVILLIMGYKLSSKIRWELEHTLNAYLEKIVQDYASSDKPLSVEYNPFVCSGVSDYKCVSKNIALIDTDSHQEILKVTDLTLKVDNITTSSVRVLIKSPKLTFDGLDKKIKENQNDEVFQIYKVFRPDSFVCSEEDKILDKKDGKISSHNQCKITANKANYSYSIVANVKSPKLSEKTILNAMISYYANFISPQKFSEEIDDFDFALENISFSFESKELKSVLYPIFESDYNANKSGKKNPFNDILYEKGLQNLKELVGFGLGVTGMLEGPYENALINLVEGLHSMAIDKAIGVKVVLMPKKIPTPYFKIHPSILLNIDKSSAQQRILAKLFNTYDLKVETILNQNEE